MNAQSTPDGERRAKSQIATSARSGHHPSMGVMLTFFVGLSLISTVGQNVYETRTKVGLEVGAGLCYVNPSSFETLF